MSFDWLNVPGISVSGDNSEVRTNNSAAPPSVSFNFGQTIPTAKSKNNPFATSAQNHTPFSNNAGHDSNAFGLSQQMIPPAKQNNSDPQHQVVDGSGSDYRETPDDLKVPLSLSQTQLTHEEIRTYLRWYKYITMKTHGKMVRLIDIFKFLHNFTITEELKLRIMTIFRTCKNALNIGQFFAVLRLISVALTQGIKPTRRMILQKATVPKPRPILSSSSNAEVYEEVEDTVPDNGATDKGNGDPAKVDFDSFASLLLTGKSQGKRIRRRISNVVFKNKRVRFSENVTFQEAECAGEPSNANNEVESPEDDTSVVEGDLDLSLPMDQLLKLMAKKKQSNSSLVSKLPTEQQETEEEREVLKDMQDSLSHFKQIRGPDSASMFPPLYLNNISQGQPNSSQQPLESLQPLKPTSTGSTNHFMREEFNQQLNQEGLPQADGVLQPLKPTATGSANYLVRSHIGTSPVNSQQSIPSDVNRNQTAGSSNGPSLEPLKPTATGSANYLMKQQHVDLPTSNQVLSPNATGYGNQQAPVADQFMNFPRQQQQQQQQQPILSPQPTVQQPVLSPQPTMQQQQNQVHLPVLQPTGRPIPQSNIYNTNDLGVKSLSPQLPLSQQNTLGQAHLNPPLVQQNTFPIRSPPTQYAGFQPQPLHGNHLVVPRRESTNPSNNSSNLAQTGNVANTYFQSLLSHSPSPHQSTTNLPGSNINQNGSPSYQMSNQQQQPQQQQQQQLYSHNNGNMVPNAYNHSNLIPQQQQQQRPQEQMYGYSPMQNTGDFAHSPMNPQHMQQQQQQQHPQGINVNQYNTFGRPLASQKPLPTQQGSNSNNNNNTTNNDILGNYQALQQQVNSLQNTYR
ncbi:Scd5p KNAG_0E00800 [Huiozyma naganishii CBS 8797]|uniref:Uncharacterized protein n=1 Tax=Huiozyma naganishii (strain ATCC MYA-139 / BCRC 22969 / CBS 8797 / KCTC 17520 / NBRC 10181 / NCYC 3082 / Yp74L-3) TaxID=1071383 RepID=J7RLF0_HUIN7|nr:hypothetical protein KNAG_0E00800 [Kazachstania naganishii CBS 8797]CCK70348.1 hypothetical protein KNAG_0E00800 [Kazachstania naganishii CBS 8797]